MLYSSPVVTYKSCSRSLALSPSILYDYNFLVQSAYVHSDRTYVPAGVVIRRDSNGNFRRSGFGQGTDINEYQGYAITSGFFLTLDREDYAVSVPRREDYFGRVSVM